MAYEDKVFEDEQGRVWAAWDDDKLTLEVHTGQTTLNRSTALLLAAWILGGVWKQIDGDETA